MRIFDELEGASEEVQKERCLALNVLGFQLDKQWQQQMAQRAHLPCMNQMKQISFCTINIYTFRSEKQSQYNSVQPHLPPNQPRVIHHKSQSTSDLSFYRISKERMVNQREEY